jgi:putative glycosyltransferase (TIGR04348 family)
MRIVVVTPARHGSHSGNRVTALRWAAHLRALGHRVAVAAAWEGEPCDLLVALHATKSHASVLRFRHALPGAPLVVGLAGTDLYEDLPDSREARRSLELATRLTVLQPLGVEALPESVRAKTRVIVQSALAVPPLPGPPGVFQVCLLAHLRAVKAPFLAAAATRRLPGCSRVQLVHLGAELDPGAADAARREVAENPRYRWLGDVPRAAARRRLAGSELLVITSRSEGGSNALSEAVACGVPVLSTRVAGTVGLLGPGYPGYFPVGDARALAALLERAEGDAGFRAELRAGVARALPLVHPAREREGWRALLDELARARASDVGDAPRSPRP